MLGAAGFRTVKVKLRRPFGAVIDGGMSRKDSAPEAVSVLTGLGFTEMEALVYSTLLSNPDLTGYRISKAINKAQANTYASLGALEQKGAVVLDEGATRVYRAVPVEELLDRLQRDFERRWSAASESLARIEVSAPAEEGVYRLKSVEQVYARARAMLAKAEKTVVFELFPRPFEQLADALRETADRGVGVFGLTFEGRETPQGVGCVLARNAQSILEGWRGNQLLVIVDGREFLIAYFDRLSGEVRHAVWSENVFLACPLHNATLSELMLHGDQRGADADSPNLHVFGAMPPGFHELKRGAGTNPAS